MFNWASRNGLPPEPEVAAGVRVLEQDHVELHQHMVFVSWDSFKRAIQNWSVIAKFGYRVGRKNPRRAEYLCIDPVCNWKVVATLGHSVDTLGSHPVITFIQPNHHCLDTGGMDAATASRQEWVQEAVSRFMKVEASTKPAEIKECIAHNYGETVNYQVAYRVRLALCADSLGAHRYAFQLLPGYISLLQEADPEGHFHLEFNAFDGNFLRCFVCPSALRRTYTNCRRYLAVDGTFLTGKFSLTLLLAVGIDANNEVVIVAWSIVESENLRSWKYFFDHLKYAVPEFAREEGVLISDRDKGLDESHVRLELGDWIHHVRCCKHIFENISEGR